MRMKIATRMGGWMSQPQVTATMSRDPDRGLITSPAKRSGAVVGPQQAVIGATRVWVLPNPSGLNAHWTPAALAGEFARLRAQVTAPSGAAPPDRPG